VPAAVEPVAARPSPWLVIVLLLVLGAIGGAMIVTRIARKNAAAALASAPVPAPSPAPAAPARAAPVDLVSDTVAALQKSQAAENARLQQELDDAKKVASAAEHKLELASQSQAPKRGTPSPGTSATAAPPPEPPHAHIYVLVRGGSPSVIIDGERTVNNAPALVEVPPGHHKVAVRGAAGNVFTPDEYNVDLAPNDTQQVIFISQRAAQIQQFRRAKKPPA
jgi:hypothetical protein